MMGFLLFRPKPKHIVMVGLGGGSHAKFCHRYLPATRIEVVEINPHVLALRDEFQIPPDDERLNVLLGDGAAFVRDAETGCDVLMVDGFDYDGQPTALCSQAFYDDCADHLQPDGILVVNLFSRHPQYGLFVERLCARQDLTASQVVRQFIRDYLAKHDMGDIATGVEAPPKVSPETKRPAASPRKAAQAGRQPAPPTFEPAPRSVTRCR